MPKGDFEFEKALKGENLSFICEVKKASPSKGVISEDFAYLQIAKEYESAGASAISCLTEPKWFMGSDKYLKIPLIKIVGIKLPKSMKITTPALAPAETPIIDGSASGFLNKVCIKAPLSPKEIPTKIAKKILGSLISDKT